MDAKSERERLVEIIDKVFDSPISNEDERTTAEEIADAVLQAGFGDVAARDKRIAELEVRIEEMKLLAKDPLTRVMENEAKDNKIKRLKAIAERAGDVKGIKNCFWENDSDGDAKVISRWLLTGR